MNLWILLYAETTSHVCCKVVVLFFGHKLTKSLCMYRYLKDKRIFFAHLICFAKLNCCVNACCYKNPSVILCLHCQFLVNYYLKKISYVVTTHNAALYEEKYNLSELTLKYSFIFTGLIDTTCKSLQYCHRQWSSQIFIQLLSKRLLLEAVQTALHAFFC